LELSDDPDERRDGMFSLSSSTASAFMESKVTDLSGLLLILMPFEGRGEARAAPGHLTTHTHNGNDANVKPSNKGKVNILHHK
jgi:hypothetical protein